MIAADVFIYLVYMFFGIFQYSYQGQYTFASAIQSTTPFNYRTAGNVLAIIGGLIAAALYGNIGIKVIYNNVLMEILRKSSVRHTSHVTDDLLRLPSPHLKGRQDSLGVRCAGILGACVCYSNGCAKYW
jgi:hypothetical protein